MVTVWHGRGLCRMKMLPVMILANYHSSARSAVSERPNESIPDRREPYRRVPLGRVHVLDERRLDEVQ